MSIVDDLIANLIQRNALRLNGSLKIALIPGGAKVGGTVVCTVRDQSKNKDILNINAPVDATIQVGELVIPVPKIP
jgi:hypothetical protein